MGDSDYRNTIFKIQHIPIPIIIQKNKYDNLYIFKIPGYVKHTTGNPNHFGRFI